MKKINFKQPKYVLPLIIFPFLCLFFYAAQGFGGGKKDEIVKKEGMQDNVGQVSKEVEKKDLKDKLNAYQDEYKRADGYTAVGTLDEERKEGAEYGNGYTDSEKRKLDSIAEATNNKYGGITNNRPSRPAYSTRARSNSMSDEDRALAAALSNLGTPANQQPQRANYPTTRSAQNSKPEPKEDDPMDVFKKQMSYMDSVAKSQDPEARAEAERQQANTKAEMERGKYKSLSVKKATPINSEFNTVFAKKESGFIKAIIDENIVGYAGSRLRIRLLDDIKAGNNIIRKGSYIYALISGFTQQRVKLTITTILQNDKILPIELTVYDIDGLEGLYVPSSAFREFTRNLGGESMQGFNMQQMGGSQSQNQQQFLMSTLDKVFTSTSTAIANLIRKNKAKLKYNTYLYLIDKEELKESQQNY